MTHDKKVAYVAGPYRNSPEGIRLAIEFAKVLWEEGYAVICPHANSFEFELAVPHDHLFLEGYLEILRRCDVMFVLPGWKKSEGTLAEIELAEEIGIKIVWVNVKEGLLWWFDRVEMAMTIGND